MDLVRQHPAIPSEDIVNLLMGEKPSDKKPRYHKPANKRPKKAGRRWTDADIKLLQELRGRGTSIERMADILGRTDKAIQIALFKINRREPK